jgi:hypothetical protein
MDYLPRHGEITFHTNEAYVLVGEVVEKDGERAKGEKHVDLSLGDDASTGESDSPRQPVS